MSETRPLQNNVDFIRCNLRVLKETHPEMFEHLSQIPEKGRAEECRYLMRLGMMVKNGQLGGAMAMAMPQMMAMPQQIVASPVAGMENAQPQAIASQEPAKEKPKDPSMVELSDTDVDFGDELLGL